MMQDLVLGLGIIVAVLGLGVLAVYLLERRELRDQRDWELVRMEDWARLEEWARARHPSADLWCERCSMTVIHPAEHARLYHTPRPANPDDAM